MAEWGATKSVTIGWPLAIGLGLMNLQWFVAGWLCAAHGWLGAVIAAALTIPFRLVRRVVAYVEEARRG